MNFFDGNWGHVQRAWVVFKNYFKPYLSQKKGQPLLQATQCWWEGLWEEVELESRWGLALPRPAHVIWRSHIPLGFVHCTMGTADALSNDQMYWRMGKLFVTCDQRSDISHSHVNYGLRTKSTQNDHLQPSLGPEGRGKEVSVCSWCNHANWWKLSRYKQDTSELCCSQLQGILGVEMVYMFYCLRGEYSDGAAGIWEIQIWLRDIFCHSTERKDNLRGGWFWFSSSWSHASLDPAQRSRDAWNTSWLLRTAIICLSLWCL